MAAGDSASQTGSRGDERHGVEHEPSGDSRRSARQNADAAEVIMAGEREVMLSRIDALAGETEAAIKRLYAAQVDLVAAYEQSDHTLIAAAQQQVAERRAELARIAIGNLTEMTAQIATGLDNFDIALAKECAATEPPIVEG